MLYTIKNLNPPTVVGSSAAFRGDGGTFLLTIHAPRVISISYRFDESIASAERDEPYPGLLRDEFGVAAAPSWDSWSEAGGEIELSQGATTVRVDKATARVDVYEGGVLQHGGAIGDKDLVVPQHPFRAQRGRSEGTLQGRLNFRLEKEDTFFGLGEKSGSLNKRGRSFKLYNRDALAYDARRSDPLYKSVPFLIKINKTRRTCCGLYFPNLQIDEINLGEESEFFYSVDFGAGPFCYFLMIGSDYKEIISSYCGITGSPALPPLFSFGYLTSSMGYTDPDDARQRVLEFFNKVEEYDIPCEGMYFSSGYARADSGERYTFVWNRKKFPDPRGFLAGLRARGYRVCCNVKPGILTTHPWYDLIAASGAFIEGEGGAPLVSYYWGNSASLIDFSRPEGYDWWVRSLTANILDEGVSGVWNDNNEFEVEDESLPMQKCKKFMPVKMAQASYEALRAARPGKRPWLVSRSGYAGLQRYARTWTGDNVSDYEAMRCNIAMGMNLGLSGMPIYGHDIGGFVGPDPDEELLLRWCQSAVFQPRYVMHSWKPDGWITEPWSFPARLAAMRDFIRERYRFLPYLYDLAIRAASTGAPMESQVAMEFPDDPVLSLESLDRMAGGAILVPGPPERGAAAATIRLPSGVDWFDPREGRLLAGGSDYEFAYPADEPRYFFRCGSVVPTSLDIRPVGKGVANSYSFLLFPARSGAWIPHEHFEDDGESDFIEGSYWRYHIECSAAGCRRHAFTLSRRGAPCSRGFSKHWEFTVPDGFIIRDADGCDRGRTIGFELADAPEKLAFTVEGEYRLTAG